MEGGVVVDVPVLAVVEEGGEVATARAIDTEATATGEEAAEGTAAIREEGATAAIREGETTAVIPEGVTTAVIREGGTTGLAE